MKTQVVLTSIFIACLCVLFAVPIYNLTSLYIFQPDHAGSKSDLDWRDYFSNVRYNFIFSGYGNFWKLYITASWELHYAKVFTITIKSVDKSMLDGYFKFVYDKTGIYTTSNYTEYENIFLGYNPYYFTTYTIHGTDAKRKKIIVNDVYNI